jgi:hypothetical protein
VHLDGKADVEPREHEPERVSEVEPEVGLDPPRPDVPAASAEPQGRRYPSTLGGMFYLVVLGISAVGLAVVSQGHWRAGVKAVAGGLVLAALVRLAIPAQQAGMLAVRRRSVDVVILVLLGAALWFLSSSIPNQPPL